MSDTFRATRQFERFFLTQRQTPTDSYTEPKNIVIIHYYPEKETKEIERIHPRQITSQ